MFNIKRQTLAKVQSSPITLLAYAAIQEYRGEGAAPAGRALRLCEAASAAAAIQKIVLLNRFICVRDDDC